MITKFVKENSLLVVGALSLVLLSLWAVGRPMSYLPTVHWFLKAKEQISWPADADSMRNLSLMKWREIAGTPPKLLHLNSVPQGQYVSFGKPDSWSGDIFPTANLIDALETRSYKKEIIMTYVNDAISAFEPAVNFFFSLRSMGYDHWILLVDDQNHLCEVFMDILPYSGCAWSTFREEFPGLPGGGTWSKKFALWMTAGRAIRLGYNVLTIDVDTTIHQDVYALFKSSAMAKANMIFQNEGGMNVNSGIVYLQNVNATGPVSYVINNQMIQTLRYFDQPDWLENEFPGMGNIDALYNLAWDQIQMSWHVQTVLRGVPFIQTGDRGRKRTYDHFPPNQSISKKFTVRRVEPFPWHSDVEWTPKPLQLFEVTARFAEINIPKYNKSSMDSVHVLAYPYPDKPGSFAAKFITLLENESGKIWNDPYELNATGEYPTETLGTPLEGTVFSTSVEYSTGKWWGFTPPQESFISHQVLFRGPKDMRKFYMKSLGLWHNAVDGLLYRATAGLSIKYGLQEHGRSASTKFLSLSPNLHLNITLQRWKLIVANTLLMASISNRIPVISPISCHSGFLSQENANSWFHGIPLNFRERGILVMDCDIFPEKEELCFLWHDIGGECLNKVVLPMDYDIYLKDKRVDSQRRSNTLRITTDTDDAVAMMNYHQFLSEMNDYQTEKILYLSEPVQLVGIPWSVIDNLIQPLVDCFGGLTGRPADLNDMTRLFGVQ